MKKYTYETHTSTNSDLPFIFHYNSVTNDTGNLVNWHRNIEILYFTDGSGTLLYDSNSYPVSSGTIAIINSNSIHMVQTSKSIKYFCLIPYEEFCSENGIPTDTVIFESVISDSKANEIFMKIASEYCTENSFKTAGIKSAVLEFLVYISRNYTVGAESYHNHPVSKSVENIKISLGYIHSHFKEHLTIDEIADETGLSKFHFSREFKSFVGVTPITYINMLRCESSKKMLLTGKYSVSEVLAANGFENASYFIKVFKKFNGITPSQYMKSFMSCGTERNGHNYENIYRNSINSEHYRI